MLTWWALTIGCGVGASLEDETLCLRPPTPSVAGLCAMESAAALAQEGALDEAAAACAVVASSALRDECYMQVSEALVRDEQLTAALGICADAGSLTPDCLEHAVWIASAGLVEAAPGDEDAQGAVDAFIEGLPPRPMDLPLSAWNLEAVGRAAAWHGIYAGAGSADPTAARSARPEDAPLARGAFAWEAARLLLDEAIDAEKPLHEQILQRWEGTPPALEGPALSPECWQVRLTPRIEYTSKLRGYMAPTYPGGARFVHEDPGTDLFIAALDAAWAHGADPSDAALRALLALDELPAQMTAARYVGLLPERYPTVGEALTERGKLRRYAEYTRRAAAMGWKPRRIAMSGGGC